MRIVITWNGFRVIIDNASFELKDKVLSIHGEKVTGTFYLDYVNDISFYQHNVNNVNEERMEVIPGISDCRSCRLIYNPRHCQPELIALGQQHEYYRIIGPMP